MRTRWPVNVHRARGRTRAAHELVAGRRLPDGEGEGRRAGQTPADDLARVEAVRDALGPGRPSGSTPTPPGTSTPPARAHGAARVGLEYVEQPCATLEELAALRRQLRRPDRRRVAVDEACGGPPTLRVDLREAADVVVLKVQPLGGVRARLRVAEAQRAAVRRLLGAGDLGRVRGRGRAGRRAARAALRLRPGHGRPCSPTISWTPLPAVDGVLRLREVAPDPKSWTGTGPTR